MKTILILGDSWGVPEFHKRFSTMNLKGHIQNLFLDAGYKVYNCSKNGASNLGTLHLARQFVNGTLSQLEPAIDYTQRFKNYTLLATPKSNLQTIEEDFKIDYLIWFHTEFFREAQVDREKTYNENVEMISHLVYKEYATFMKRLQCKTIVIGGQAPVHTDVLLQYIKPDLLLEDWRSDLVRGEKEFIDITLGDGTHYKSKYLPKLHSFGVHDRITSTVEKEETRIELEKYHKIINHALWNSDMFPDNCHPGNAAHAQLFKIITKFMSEDFL